ncbi:MAG: hypothetical protein LUE09_00130 [Synergistaceae bacterium]|nr:hypothetical protein [Synergistaceae bacterium]
MRLKDSKRFFRDLMEDATIRGKCIEIAMLPKNERGMALRALGYSFTPKELDYVLCREFYLIPEEERRLLGPGYLRDIVMDMWGNCM